LIFGCSFKSILENAVNIFEHFSGLTWENTNKYQITLCEYSVIVEFSLYTKLLFERSKQMRLPRTHDNLEIIKTALNLNKFGQNHRTDLAATYNAYFELRVVSKVIDRLFIHQSACS